MTNVELARLYAVIGANTDELNRKLDEATGNIGRFRGDVESAGAGTSSFFAQVASTAMGVLTSQVIVGIAQQIQSIGTSAIMATAQVQNMEIGMVGLLAREISRGQEVAVQHQVVRGLTEDEEKQLASLERQYEYLAADVAISTQRLIEAQESDSTRASTMMSLNQTLYEQQVRLEDTALAIDELRSKGDELVTVTEKYRDGTMSIAEAMPQAETRAKELMDELARVAILSPYQVNVVQNTYRTAMAFGYASDEAMKYTEAILNVAAGVGATNETLGRMSYNFAQIRMVGKVTAMDVRQLAMAGFDLNDVLRYVGAQLGLNIQTYEDFNKALEAGQVDWKQFTELFAQYARDNFGGASERMSVTLMGLQSTFNDLFMLTMPSLLLPSLEAVNQRLSNILNLFLGVRDSGVLDVLGERLGTTVERWLAPIDRLLEPLTRYDEIKATLEQPMPEGGAAGMLRAERAELRELDQYMQEMEAGHGKWGFVVNSILGPDRGTWLLTTLDTVRLKLGETLGWASDRLADISGAITPLVDMARRGDWGGLGGLLGLSPEMQEGISEVASSIGDIYDTVLKLARGEGLDVDLPELVHTGMPEDWVGAGIEIAGNLVDGIAQGVLNATTGLVQITEAVRAWAESDETQTRLETIGSEIGKAVALGLTALLGSDEAGQAWAAGMGIGLGKMLANSDAIIGAVTGQLASSFFTGFASKVGLSAEQIEEVKNIYRSSWEADTAALLKAPFVALENWIWEQQPEEGYAPHLPGQERVPKSKTSPWEQFYWGEVVPSLSEEQIGAAVKLWEEDASRRQLTTDELIELAKLPPPEAQAYRLALEMQNRLAEYESELAGIRDMGTGEGNRGTGRGWGVSAFATGADFVTNGPRLILVGDNPSGREHVSIEPIGAGQGSRRDAPLIGQMIINAPGGPAEVRKAAKQGVQEAAHATGVML